MDQSSFVGRSMTHDNAGVMPLSAEQRLAIDDYLAAWRSGDLLSMEHPIVAALKNAGVDSIQHNLAFAESQVSQFETLRVRDPQLDLVSFFDQAGQLLWKEFRGVEGDQRG